MRTFFTAFFIAGMLTTAMAQPQLVDRAIISTQTIVTAMDTGQNNKITNGKILVANKKAEDPGETISETWYVGDMIKTEVRKGNVATTTIRDNKAQKTVVYAELVKNDKGQKIYSEGPRGFYATDMELQILDRFKSNLPQQVNLNEIAPTHVKIEYQEEVKDIAGYPCKKAIVFINQEDGQPKQIIAWYNTEIKLKDLPATGDPIYGFLDARKNKTLDILAQLKGFPMEYEMQLAPGRTMKVTVTDLDVTRKMTHLKFAIPEDAKLSSFMAYMQNPGDYKINLGQVVVRKKEGFTDAGKTPDQ